MTKKLTRRHAVLSGAGLTGAVLAFPSSIFAQDATPSGSATPAASPATQGPIKSSVEGVPDAYTQYPAPFKSVDGVPGKGGEVSMLTFSYSPPPTDHDKNTFWKELETRLGTKWNASIVPLEGYNERLATTFAGGDMPDLLYLLPSSTRPVIFDALKQDAFKDLTEIVESDKIKQYPNLAAIPKYMWDATKFEGKIYGVPKPVLRNNDAAYYRADWGKKFGIELSNAQTVHDFLVNCSTKDPDGNGKKDTYGLAPYDGAWDSFLLSQMFKVPYGWRKNDDGTLTNQIETDEYRSMVEYLVQLYKDGAYHPDAASIEVTKAVDLMDTGRTGMASNGFAAVFGPTGFRGAVKDTVKTADLEPIVLPGVDGGKGVTYQTSGIYGYTAIPADRDDAKVDELLAIMNYLHAPFGSEEATFLMYGLPGKQSQALPTGGFKVTDAGRKDKGALVYPFLSENYFYYSGMPEEAMIAQKHNEAMAKVAIGNPTTGLYSKAQGDKGAALNTYMSDQLNAIVTGRQGLDAIDSMIKGWKERGGETIRKEYEEALKNAGK